jgi:hypothetical protein
MFFATPKEPQSVDEAVAGLHTAVSHLRRLANQHADSADDLTEHIKELEAQREAALSESKRAATVSGNIEKLLGL